MKGTYILILECKKDCEIVVGSLGKINFKKGYYFYVGSAMNNIEKRISRHLRTNKKVKWHIDYITSSPNFEIIKTYIKNSDIKEECEIASIFENIFEYIKNFGSSDCRNKSHLFYSNDINKINEVIKKLNFIEIDIKGLI